MILKKISVSALFLLSFFLFSLRAEALVSSCASDFNADLEVDTLDYTILAANFMKNPLINPETDLTGDNKVDLFDYTLLAADFMKDCVEVIPPSPAPSISPSPESSPDLQGYYYLSPSGSDDNAGTINQPFQTFEKALSVLQPGNTLKIAGGTYNQRLKIEINGTDGNPINFSPWDNEPVIIDLQNNADNGVWITGNYINIESIEVKNSNGYCVSLEGQHIISNNFKVHECWDHGTYVDGKDIIVDGHEIYRTNLENEARSASSGWGSALKVRVGGENLILRNNKIHDNYGEGIAVTRGINTLVQNNHVYDNYAVNIYVDNSYDVVVEKNFVTCSGSSGYEYANGDRMNGIALAEESYDNWGAQLKNIRVQNNVINGCRKGFTYFGADVSGGGMDTVLVAHNTFWNITGTGISTEAEPTKTQNTIIANNIVHFASGGKFASVASRDGIDMHHNFWVEGIPEDWMNAIGTGDVTGAVNFASGPDTNSAQSFKLGSNSPAIDAAGSVSPHSAISTDFENKDRGTNKDIGAFEY